MFETIKDLDVATIDDFIETIKTNSQKANKIREEINKRRKVSFTFANKTNSSVAEEDKEAPTNDESYEDFLLECAFFEEQIGYLSTDYEDLESAILSMLDSVSEEQKNRVLLRTSADFYKKSLDTKSTLKELIDQMSVEDILGLREEISGYETMQRALISVYKQRTRNSFIMVPMKDGSIKFLSSFEEVKDSKGDSIFDLLERISENNDSSKKETHSVYSLGNTEVSILYDRLDSKHIALIDIVFNKKVDKEAIETYKSSKPKLVKSLNNPEFIALQNGYVSELYKGMKKEVPYQYKKGDINGTN